MKYNPKESVKRIGICVAVIVPVFFILFAIQLAVENNYTQHLAKSAQAVCDAAFEDMYTVKKAETVSSIRSVAIVEFTLVPSEKNEDDRRLFIMRLTGIAGFVPAVYVEKNKIVSFIGIAGVSNPLISIESVGLTNALIRGGEKKLESLLADEEISYEE